MSEANPMQGGNQEPKGGNQEPEVPWDRLSYSDKIVSRHDILPPFTPVPNYTYALYITHSLN